MSSSQSAATCAALAHSVILAPRGILGIDRVARCGGNGEDRIHHFMRGVFGDKVANRRGAASVDAIERPEGAELSAGFLSPGEFGGKLILVPLGCHLTVARYAGPHL